MGARSRGRDRASRTHAPQWTPASIAGLTALYAPEALASSLSHAHEVGEGPYSASGVDYPTVDAWTSSVAGAPSLSQSTAGARPFERGDVFEARRARGLYFKRGRFLTASSRTAFDHLHDSTGSTLAATFLVQHFEAGSQTIVMTRAIECRNRGGVWVLKNGLTLSDGPIAANWPPTWRLTVDGDADGAPSGDAVVLGQVV